MAWWNPISWLTPDRRSLENPSTSLSAPAAWLLDLYGAPSAAGERVNEETALNLSTVYACVRVLSWTMASLPVRLYRNLPNGDVEPAFNRPENRLIAVNPSRPRLYTPYTFRSTGQGHISTNGNFYARIQRDGVYRPNDLRILHPQRVTPFLFEDRLYYRYQGDAGTEVLTADEVLHIKAFSTDGITGKSPITVLRETIGNALAGVKYEGAMKKNGGRIPGVLKHPAKLQPEQLEDLRKSWKSQFGGAENAGSIPILQSGMEFQSVSISPADAQFLQSQRVAAEDICRAFGVPQHMVGLLERSTNNNIEHQGLEYIQHTVRPIAENWEAELNASLLPLSLQGEYFFRYDLDELMRGDMRSQAEYFSKLFNVGVMSQNEIRRKLGFNRIDGGDAYFVPVNVRDHMAPMIDPNIQQNPSGDAQDDTKNDEQPNAAA
jgi:HK97 family phage portal protein